MQDWARSVATLIHIHCKCSVLRWEHNNVVPLPVTGPIASPMASLFDIWLITLGNLVSQVALDVSYPFYN